MSSCWNPKLKPRAIVVNLLVCRLQRDIDRDRATRRLLALIHPKLLKTASRLMRNSEVSASLDEIVIDMQRVVVESLLTQYRLGETMHPLRWLFGFPKGAIHRWVSKTHTAARRRARHVSFDDVLEELPALSKLPVEYDAAAQMTQRLQAAQLRIDDGVTLSLIEYRVLSFCLRHAQTHGRPLAGVHQQLAGILGVSRNRIGRIYRQGCLRLMEAMNHLPTHFAQRGVTISRTVTQRRRGGASSRVTITPAEIHEAGQLKMHGLSLTEIAWLFNISADSVRRLLRRFDGCTLGQIESICLAPSSSRTP